MDVTITPLPGVVAAVAWAGAVGVLAWAWWAAPWRRLASNEASHVWYGTIFTLVVLWSIRATLADGVVIHLLGVGAFALAAGGPLALLGGALVVAFTTAVHATPAGNAGAVYLQNVALPVAVTLATLRGTQRWLPANFFVYVWGAGFVGPALGLAAAGLAGAAVVAMAGGPGAAGVFDDYAPYLVYLAFAEGTLSGMLITLLVVYRPRWVATFEDERYLNRP
ncbi:MAG: hypothetical protein U1F15_03300 [Burkholderiales bacterium]